MPPTWAGRSWPTRPGTWSCSYREYLAAVNSAGAEPRSPRRSGCAWPSSRSYDNRDTERAAFYARRIEPGGAARRGSRMLLERLRRRLSYRELAPESIGLGDGNISALRVDGDDLWIGTWNGGVAACPCPAARSGFSGRAGKAWCPPPCAASRSPPPASGSAPTRACSPTPRPAARGRKSRPSAGADPRKVEALRLADGRLYVGTLGQGLWRQEAEGWSRLSSGLLPGDFVTCLEADGEDLLIGTLTQGVVRLDLASLALRSFDRAGGGPGGQEHHGAAGRARRGLLDRELREGPLLLGSAGCAPGAFQPRGRPVGGRLGALRGAGRPAAPTSARWAEAWRAHSGGGWERLGFRAGSLCPRTSRPWPMPRPSSTWAAWAPGSPCCARGSR